MIGSVQRITSRTPCVLLGLLRSGSCWCWQASWRGSFRARADRDGKAIAFWRPAGLPLTGTPWSINLARRCIAVGVYAPNALRSLAFARGTVCSWRSALAIHWPWRLSISSFHRHFFWRSTLPTPHGSGNSWCCVADPAPRCCDQPSLALPPLLPRAAGSWLVAQDRPGPQRLRESGPASGPETRFVLVPIIFAHERTDPPAALPLGGSRSAARAGAESMILGRFVEKPRRVGSGRLA